MERSEATPDNLSGLPNTTATPDSADAALAADLPADTASPAAVLHQDPASSAQPGGPPPEGGGTAGAAATRNTDAANAATSAAGVLPSAPNSQRAEAPPLPEGLSARPREAAQSTSDCERCAKHTPSNGCESLVSKPHSSLIATHTCCMPSCCFVCFLATLKE